MESVAADPHITDELGTRSELVRQMFEQAPTFMAMLRGREHRIEMANPGYLQLVGHRPVVGRTVAEALPEAAGQGFLTLLDNVFDTGEAFTANGHRYAFQAEPDAPLSERFVDFVYQPIRGDDGDVIGIFVEGVDVTARVTGQRLSRRAVRLSASSSSTPTDPDEIGVRHRRGPRPHPRREPRRLRRDRHARRDHHHRPRLERARHPEPGRHAQLPRLRHLHRGSQARRTVIFADAREDPRTARLAPTRSTPSPRAPSSTCR